MFTTLNIEGTLKQTLFTDVMASNRIRPNMTFRSNANIPKARAVPTANQVQKSQKDFGAVCFKPASSVTMSMTSGNDISTSGY